MICKKCNVENREGAKFCRKCGAQLTNTSEKLFSGVIGKTDILNQVVEIVNMYNEEKQRGNPRPDMDTLIVGNSGSGKTYLAELIQHYFFEKGVISNGDFKRIDASSFNEMSDEDLEKYNNAVLFIDNVHLLMTNPDSISPIDKLLSKMEDWEHESKRDTGKSYSFPIVIFAGDKSIVDSFFSKKTSGMTRFGLQFELSDYSVDDLYKLCKTELGRFMITEEADKKLHGFFRELVRNRKINNFRNASEAVEKSNQIKNQMFKNKHKDSVEADDITGKIYYERKPEEIIAQLDAYTGIDNVKREVHSWIDKIEQYRKEKNDPKAMPPFRDHFIFTGNPGTGKTTIARVFADVLSALGVLPNGQLIEVTREDLVGQHVGSTAPKTHAVVESAMGGVLFIDEAYTLATGGDSDFGREAINALLKPVEERRGEFVCIIAGYSKEMLEFVNANSGIASRFNKKIEFEDYKPAELTQIFRNIVKKENFTFDVEADDCLSKFFEKMYALRTVNFGNAREVVNAFRKAKDRHSQRLTKNRLPSDKVFKRVDIEGEEALKVLSVDDIVADLDNKFVGMSAVKDFVKKLATQKIYMDERLERGLPVDQTMKLNIILTGNPGTGKTTVARELGKIFYSMKILSSPEVIERERKDIVGKYANSGGEEMGKACDLAMGKVLFIDEAYAFAPVNDAGTKDEEATKAVEVLMKRMEDDAGKFAVILAGYPGKMDDFVRVNEGIARRITYRINIDDYTPIELSTIFKQLAKKKGFTLTGEAEVQLFSKIEDMISRKDSSWGNAGEMTKLFSVVKERLAERVRMIPRQQLTTEAFTTIESEDIPFEKPKVLDTEQALANLDKLVGLQNIKDQLRSMIASFKMSEATAKMSGGKAQREAPHYIFMGNPGTGKTTVAKLMADILASIGVLSRGHLVEATEKDLVASYVGQTAIKTTNVINSAMGGVLFIDEAYSLNKGNGSGANFGQEAINTLLERLTRDAGKFVCVLAGYKKEMKEFLETNSGLARRFRIIDFEDYKADELELIFRNLLTKNGLKMDDYAEKNISAYFQKVYDTRDVSSFGNAGAVVNIFKLAKERQGKRLMPLFEVGRCSDEDMHTLTLADISGESGAAKPIAEIMKAFDKHVGGGRAIEAMATVLRQINVERRRAKVKRMPFKNLKTHFAFIGNPDTGQQDFIDIMAFVLRDMYVINDVDVNNIDLERIAQNMMYQPTATDSMWDDNLSGILVLDKAAVLLDSRIPKRLESDLYQKIDSDERGTIYILPVTANEWTQLSSDCPRLTSLFRDEFIFDDYTPEELSMLFINYAVANGMSITEDAKQLIPKYFASHREFGKAEIKTLFTDVTNNLDHRIAELEFCSDEELTLIIAKDIPVDE